MSLRALFIREVGIPILGGVFGVLIMPVHSTSSLSDLAVKFFQSFFIFITSLPWLMTPLAAYTIAYFRCRQIFGEASEPVISEFRGLEFPNRIPAVSAQSKMWLVAMIATLLIAVYTYRENEISNTARTGERLVKAAEAGRILQMKELLASGADPNAESGGWSPLTRSVLFGQDRAVEVLLAAGADVNSYSRYIGSALYLAVAARRPDLVRKLLDHGADPNATPSWGQTPLMFAAMQGNTDVARLLLERGADPARRSPGGERASTYARREGHLDLAGLLEGAERR
jgi:ankyrin repeat protein